MYRSKGMGWLKHADFIFIDGACLIFSFILSCFLRLGVMDNNIAGCFDIFIHSSKYIILLLLFPLVHMFLVFFYSAYRGVLNRGMWAEFKATLMHCILIFAFIISFLFLGKMSDLYSRIVVCLTMFFSVITMYAARMLHKRALKKKGRRSKASSAVFVMSDSAHIAETVDALIKNNVGAYVVSGLIVCGEDRVGQKVSGVPVVGSDDTWQDYITRNVVDEVYINLNSENDLKEKTEFIISTGATAHIVLDMESLSAPNKMLQTINGLNVVSASLNIASPRQRLIKRAVDIMFGLIGSVATIVLTVIIGPLIFLEDKGPIFFLQKRVGRNGRIFKIIKFRTMYTDAEERKAALLAQNEMDGLMFKMKDDPRITKIGKFLRKTSLDELPQSFNILLGTMSVVGTRPPTFDEYKQYKSHHKVRLGITPGLTGMWQVSGRSQITDFEEIVRLDEKYIREWRLALDAKIILKTFLVVLKREGAE